MDYFLKASNPKQTMAGMTKIPLAMDAPRLPVVYTGAANMQIMPMMNNTQAMAQ